MRVLVVLLLVVFVSFLHSWGEALSPREQLRVIMPSAYEALLRVEARHGRTYITEEEITAVLQSEDWHREHFLEYQRFRNELCAQPEGQRWLICREEKHKG